MRSVKVAGCALLEPPALAGAAALARTATRRALADASIEPARLSAVFIGSGRGGGGAAVAVRLALRGLGLRAQVLAGGEPPTSSQAAGASAVVALHQAWYAVACGGDDAILCIGIDEPGERPDTDPRMRALAARRSLHRHRATQADLGSIAAKNHRHGAGRGIARALSVREALHSELVDWPLTRAMVAAPGAGAAAVVLVANGAASQPRIRASAFADGVRESGEHVSIAARQAYREAGVAPDEVDCAEVHDLTAAAELDAYEDLGWAAGHARELVRSGFTALGGVLPVNTSGGLLCLGERPGTAAIAQVVALARQLRGVAGPVQVPGAGTALAYGAGPSADGLTEAATVTVLSM